MTDSNDSLGVYCNCCDYCLDEKKIGTKSSYVIQTGRRGPIGLDGPKGPQGEPGLPGPRGERGFPGKVSPKRYFSQCYYGDDVNLIVEEETIAKLYYFKGEIISRLVITGHNEFGDDNFINISISSSDELIISKRVTGTQFVLDLSHKQIGDLESNGGILGIEASSHKPKEGGIYSLYLELMPKDYLEGEKEVNEMNEEINNEETQTKEINNEESQTKEINNEESQTKEINNEETQTKEINNEETQTKEINNEETQTKEINNKETRNGKNKIKETTETEKVKELDETKEILIPVKKRRGRPRKYSKK